MNIPRLVRVGLLIAVLLVFVPLLAQADTPRKISVPVVLGGPPRYVWSEHGKLNGMDCWWYEYATSVGLDYCTHPGMDIDANFEPVYSATTGRVIFAGASDAYWPNYVAIRVTSGKWKHDTVFYGHLSEVDVVLDQKVKAGDRIGVSGTAGSGPHLHFEVRTPPTQACPLGCAVDPEPLLTKRK